MQGFWVGGEREAVQGCYWREGGGGLAPILRAKKGWSLDGWRMDRVRAGVLLLSPWLVGLRTRSRKQRQTLWTRCMRAGTATPVAWLVGFLGDASFLGSCWDRLGCSGQTWFLTWAVCSA